MKPINSHLSIYFDSVSSPDGSTRLLPGYRLDLQDYLVDQYGAIDLLFCRISVRNA